LNRYVVQLKDWYGFSDEIKRIFKENNVRVVHLEKNTFWIVIIETEKTLSEVESIPCIVRAFELGEDTFKQGIEKVRELERKEMAEYIRAVRQKKESD
jgi:hypothetical protein